MAVHYDTAPPDDCERLAWIAGQTNYLDLATGLGRGSISIEEEVAALAMSRQGPDDIGPEVMEVYWAGCNVHRWGVCQAVFDALLYEIEVKPKDRLWVRGAILDAFDRFRTSHCPDHRVRAKRFTVRGDDYLTVRNLSERILYGFESHARSRWLHARFRLS
jgi:hypothetical protein